jgi:hypothetical protein
MTIAELITSAKKEGLVFYADGEQIRCKLPKPTPFRIKPLVDELRQRRDEVVEALKLELHRDFPGHSEKKTISCDLEAGEIVAVEITSEILGADIWLSFRNDFSPGDGKAVFYSHELPVLRTKTPEQLRAIYKVKLTFGAGSRVRPPVSEVL